MTIHPTAIIDSSAVIGSDVEIGPYVIIGPDVQIGDRCRIQAHAVIESAVEMGPDNLVGYGSVIGAPPQDLSFDASMKTGVRIGSGNTFREHVTVHRATGDGKFTTVGDSNFLMTGMHIGHNTQIGNRTVIANACLLAGHVQVDDGAVLGGGSVFHQWVRVGRLCMVRGGGRFGKDIPPFTTADNHNLLAGINLIGLRRAGVSSQSRTELRNLFRQIYWSPEGFRSAVRSASLQSWGPEASEFLDFFTSLSRRGVSLSRRSRTVAEPAFE